MSQEQQQQMEMENVVASRVKKPTLSGKLSKFMQFGFWFAQLEENLEVKDLIIKNIKMFDTAEDQTAFYQRFLDDNKDINKHMRKTVVDQKRSLAKALKVEARAKAKADKPVKPRQKKSTAVVDTASDAVSELVILARTSSTTNNDNTKKPRAKKLSLPEPQIIVEEEPVSQEPVPEEQPVPEQPVPEQPVPVKKEKPVKEKAEKPVKEKAEKVVKEKAEKVVKEKAEKPVKEKAEKVVKEKAEKVVKEKTEKPATATTPEDDDDDLDVDPININGLDFLIDSSDNLYHHELHTPLGKFDRINNKLSLF